MSKKRVARRKGSNIKGIAGITVIVGILLASLTMQSNILKARSIEYEQQARQLKEQIAEENARKEEINNMKEYMQSREYVEEIAKDKLGLAYEDEIIFKPEE